MILVVTRGGNTYRDSIRGNGHVAELIIRDSGGPSRGFGAAAVGRPDKLFSASRGNIEDGPIRAERSCERFRV